MGDRDPEPDFDADLQFGTKWEQYVADPLREQLQRVLLENVVFEEQPDVQKGGIDIITSLDPLDFDIKTQRYKHVETGNLPIEVWSDYEAGRRGWFHDTDADVIVWLYENRAGTNLYPRGYFMPLGTGVREWFDSHKEDFRRVPIKNSSWTTVCRLVPVCEFRPEHLIEFDPTLPDGPDTDQSSIDEWFGGGEVDDD